MLSGLLHPTSGTATVLGFTPARRERDYLRQITLVMGQRNQLVWDIPAIDSYELFKAIYDPRRREAGAYLVVNAAGARPQKISIAELEKVAGISTFPSLSDRVKSRVMILPDPGSNKERRERRGR